MKLNGRQIVGLIFIVLFGARIIFTITEKNRRDREFNELMQSLPSPSELPAPDYSSAFEIEIPEMPEGLRESLDSIGARLDSLGREIEQTTGSDN